MVSWLLVRPELPFSMYVCQSYSQLILIFGAVLSLKSCNRLSDVCRWNDLLSLRRKVLEKARFGGSYYTACPVQLSNPEKLYNRLTGDYYYWFVYPLQSGSSEKSYRKTKVGWRWLIFQSNLMCEAAVISGQTCEGYHKNFSPQAVPSCRADSYWFDCSIKLWNTVQIRTQIKKTLKPLLVDHSEI